MARESPDWGYDRIQGALANLGYTISDQTVGNILKAHGIKPAPERKRQTTWKTYIKAHWDVLAAIDVLLGGSLDHHDDTGLNCLWYIVSGVDNHLKIRVHNRGFVIHCTGFCSA